MIIQLVVIFLSFVLMLIMQKQYPGDTQRKLYIIFVCILMILQSGLRNWAIGSDTYAYKLLFDKYIAESWQTHYQNFLAMINGENVDTDAGYPFICKIVGLFSNNYQIFLIVVATIFFTAFGRLLYYYIDKYEYIFFSVVLYQTYFYGFFSITGLRQTIATAILLFGIELIRKRKLLYFLAVVLLATFVHRSALIFIPFYFIANIKHSKTLLIYGLLLFPVVFVESRNLTMLMVRISGSEDYMAYAISTYETAGALFFTIYLLLVAFVTLIVYNNLDHSKFIVRLSINALSLAIFFSPLTWVDPSLMRIVQYFSVFTIFLVPNIINKLSIKFINSTQIYYLIVMLFIGIIIYRGQDYAFCWESMRLLGNYNNRIIV